MTKQYVKLWKNGDESTMGIETNIDSPDVFVRHLSEALSNLKVIKLKKLRKCLYLELVMDTSLV